MSTTEIEKLKTEIATLESKAEGLRGDLAWLQSEEDVVLIGGTKVVEFPELSRFMFARLFNKAGVNVVAYKNVVEAQEELYKMVCMAIHDDREIRGGE